MLTWVPRWPAPPPVRCAFSCRDGGVSRAPFESLNLAAHVGDDPAAVAENRRRLRDELRLPEEPLWLDQQHGVQVVDADDLDPGSARGGVPCADAAVTRHPGRVLAVLVADCLPVLLARQDGRAVAVAHAGWRGLAAGVLEAVVAALGGPGAAVQAWLGPAIGSAHFEVGEDVYAAFCGPDPGAAPAFRPNARGRWQCDLRGLARRRLAALAVRSVHDEDRCSYRDAEHCFSYRRDGRTGRMAALIWLEGARARDAARRVVRA